VNPAVGNVVQASAPTPAPRGGSARAEEGGFARLLQGAPPEAAGRPAEPGRADAGPAAAERRDGQHQDAPGPPDAAGDPPATDAADPATTGNLAAATDDSDTVADEDTAADAWPPPGLGWLLQPAQPAPVPGRSQPSGPAAANGPLSGDMPQLPGLPGTAASLAPAQPQAAAAADAGALPLAEAGTLADTALADTALAQTRTVAADAEAPAAVSFALPMAPATPATGLAPPAAAASTAAHLPAPVLHDPGFGEEVGNHVQWLAGQKIGQAVIRISPQDLGPVEVRLHLDGDRLSADFSSAHAEVRQALEHGLSRLREMLGQHGLELAHAGVGDHRRDAPGQERPAAGGGAHAGSAAPSGGDAALAPALPVRGRGLLDAYA